MENHFDDEMKVLKQRLLQMGDLVQEMIALSISALKDRSEGLVQEVFHVEEQVNHLEVEIEEAALVLLARHQPAAKDLRFLTSVLQINNDLERAADQAVNIAETTVFLLKEPPLKPLIDIPYMAELAQKMIRNALNAFVHHDPRLAKEVCGRDDQVDKLNDQVFRELLTYMIENPRSITRAVDLILVARNLERIADLATNIGEEVVFIEEGKNIKHRFVS